jgi:hypothetical protein
MSNSFSQLVDITEQYLGPAAERFLIRHVDFHCKKNVKDINIQDIAKLKSSLVISFGLLIKDKKTVEEFGEKLNNLIK